jgi:CheY-like chemotaxis protein
MARILLVDDDESFRPMVEAMLRRLGHQVVMAANGNEALAIFRTEAFDLVITDLIMPEREGLDTIRELRRDGDVKIIAMSGGGRWSPATFLNIARRTGAAAVLSKPFSHQELMAALDTVLSSDGAG